MKTQWTDRKFKDKYTEKRSGRTSRIFTIGKFKGKMLIGYVIVFQIILNGVLNIQKDFLYLKKNDYLIYVHQKID